MLLRQIVCDKTNLTLSKEKKEVKYNDTFEVSDERAEEILKRGGVCHFHGSGI